MRVIISLFVLLGVACGEQQERTGICWRYNQEELYRWSDCELIDGVGTCWVRDQKNFFREEAVRTLPDANTEVLCNLVTQIQIQGEKL